MRVVLTIAGVFAVLVGSIWFLQGISVLPGSFMTGQTKWAIIGAIAFGAGVTLLAFTNRRGRT